MDKEIIHSAIRNHKTLHINYLSSKGKNTGRIIHPARVQKKYLIAYCEKRNDIRIFRLDRIKSVQALNQSSDDELVELAKMKETPQPHYSKAKYSIKKRTRNIKHYHSVEQQTDSYQVNNSLAEQKSGNEIITVIIVILILYLLFF